jgi:AAA domain/UvrD-like helicase C-terminal domain
VTKATTEPNPVDDRLTTEQELIASAPPNARLLVTAGAGTGKTHVLIARLQHLADDYDLNLADDVLVVSFSRAAVGEIRRRMRQGGGAAAYGAVSTFDSYAAQLLARFAPEKLLGRTSFDERIEAASELIRSSEETQEHLRLLRHVIVDEVQDLVGVRRELVQVVLEHAHTGFSLFGDPAQGIYNFQAEDRLERQVGSLLFFQWVRNTFDNPAVEEVTLTKNFRYQTEEARSADWAGPRLNSPEPDFQRILERLEDGLYDLEPVGRIDDIVPELRALSRRGDGETIGILCHFNFEVLRVSERLAKAGINHHYQRPAADRTVPAWVARALRTYDTTKVGRSAFEAHAATLDGIPSDAWLLLKRCDPRGNRDSLDLGKVQERIRLGDIPPELTEPAPATIIVSTIHRAKGLEFDRVLLFEPDGTDVAGETFELGESARQLYVARTRARRRYGVLTRDRREYAKRLGNPGDVWAVYSFAGRRRYVSEIEIQGNQSWAQDPAGAFGFTADAEQTQRYIESEVRPLQPLELRRALVEMPDGPRYYYVIEHKGLGVGVADIGTIIKVLCRPKYERNWPSRIDGIFVESVDTAAGTSAAGTRARLTSSGLWMRVRPYGLGRLHWGGE